MTAIFDTLVTIALFILVLGGLVLFHELGHFITARLARVRVLEFGVGFPPRAKGLGRGGVSSTDAEAYRLFTLRDVTDMVEGRSPGARSSLNKVWWSELDVRLHEAALGLLGPLAELEGDAPAAVDHGAWMKGYQFALSGPIYAGTNEIQRNVVAERVLGLPRV